MRAARLVTVMVLAAHGSVDPRSSAVAHALAGRIRRLRPGLDVRPAFLEKATPHVGDVLADVAHSHQSAVVVPMLLADAYHARVDLPSVIECSGAVVRLAGVLGEDPALVTLLGRRLADAGVSADRRDVGVVVVAVGSSSEEANVRTAALAPALAARTRWAGVEVAFATGPHPTLAEAAARLRRRGAREIIVAPWFLAPGRITDRVAASAAELGIPMAEPLGAHNLVAAALLDRFDDIRSALIAA
ncbi:CbiX/SirB N-terminal domain-containing protein [Mycolicibacterium sp.]|uniref:sirohydrochlorin chelatase n=1 Tax=Mycolicibacterium sp. TaxID=2320850 RepID=UPI001A2B999F|nr:CbiX/SirB N-terminal domain-containing protein [Mycolicibacterium sp.]MBJ7340900.1 sirohydrochlorin chelatase [Mycolicibacterium sp.]